MLTRTLRKNLKAITNYEKGLKSEYTSLIQNNYDNLEQDANNILLKNKLEEIFDETCIVDDPTQVIVEFPIISEFQPDEKLPFFKSITYKLQNIFN